jgi:hypothetical protein
MFTFGADPEIFVKDKKGNPVSAYGLVEGTKESPKKTDLGAYQVDGTALEFNIEPVPQHDFDRFNLNVVQTIADLKAAVGPDYKFSKDSVQEYDPEYLEQLPDEAKELGCDPDYNAYTMEANPRPDGTRNFRTGAGHIHIGWGADIPPDNEDHAAICAAFVKVLDATVGMLMTYIDREPRRRELYGKAGAHRRKPYGVEYRTPSNAWVWNKTYRKAMHYMLNQAIQYNTAYYGDITRASQGYIHDEAELQRVINEGDWEKAKLVLQLHMEWQDNRLWKALVKKVEG